MGAATNTVIIMSIFGFYVFLGVMFGLIGGSLQNEASDNFGNPPEPGITFLTQIGYFFGGIGYTLLSLPLWANTILFLPLGITLFYLGLIYLRGTS